MEKLKVSVIVTLVISTLIHNSAQVQMNISPGEVVLTSSSPVSTTFTCRISSSLSISSIYNMQIKRQRVIDSSLIVLAEVTNTNNNPIIVTNAPQDIITRATASGGIDTNTPAASTLILTMNTADVTCNDRGDYQCVLVYQATDNSVPTVEHNKTLSIYALPSDLSLSAKRNGQLIQGTVSDEADVNVNEAVEFTCTANIGSDNSTTIRWKRTSEIGTVDNFITYNPPQGTYTEGTASTGNTACTFSRTATMTYNVTSFDANRDNNLAFQCYISVTPPGQSNYETQNPPSFYINPLNPNDDNTDRSTDTSSAGTSGNIAGIIGGVVGGLVLIAAIVIIACFLWMRRGSPGESYRTKEETGGSNPNIVGDTVNNDNTYAVPNKERKRGHENKGLEDRHSNRNRYEDNHDDDRFYNNPRGRANYAMDDDDDDGGHYTRANDSPNINHMGLDPDNGSFGTGV